MQLLDSLERRFRRFALPQVTLALIGCQVVVYLLSQAQPNLQVIERLDLIPEKVLEGEVWRLFTFMCMPPFGNLIAAFFFWYLFYLMGTALELHWGTFRYNVYLLIGYLATVGVAFCWRELPATNLFLQSSVFLAFAHLYPDFELYIFFIIPVKVKWLALLAWLGYLVELAFGTWLSRALILASISNYLLFFGRDLLEQTRRNRRRLSAHVQRPPDPHKVFHRCTVCGITDRSHPKMDFRYCSKCEGTYGYCAEHLRNHEHITAANAEQT
jgi:hypothetical protein